MYIWYSIILGCCVCSNSKRQPKAVDTVMRESLIVLKYMHVRMRNEGIRATPSSLSPSRVGALCVSPLFVLSCRWHCCCFAYSQNGAKVPIKGYMMVRILYLRSERDSTRIHTHDHIRKQHTTHNYPPTKANKHQPRTKSIEALIQIKNARLRETLCHHPRATARAQTH